MQRNRITITVILLYPFSLIYRAVVEIRNMFFEWRILPVTEFNLPVISVGNITVGGTGKTPQVEYLVELLKDEFKLAYLSRGYKRKTSRFMVADMQSSASVIGDEPRQLKQKFPELTVAVDRRRVNGIRQILKMHEPPDVILLDDAYQHRYVNPGKSILLIDYNRNITEDFLLPAGRLREPVSAKKRADIILITKSPNRLKPIEMRNLVKKLNIDFRQHLFFTTIKYHEIRSVFDIAEQKNAAYFKDKRVPVLLLTGIANPRHIRTYARSISTNLHEIAFPDHHAYSEKDILKILNRLTALDHPETLVLTTEKDAMRLQELPIPDSLKKSLYYVPIRVDFLNDDREDFNKIILNYVRSNKRDNILHKETDNTPA
ncbi:MAG: tetraacyldisaccharide 4'-kinase [Bacteroidales bacterium]